MYRQNKMDETTIRGVVATVGRTMEQKMFAMLNNNEPIDDGGEIIYIPEADGVRPEFDIRTNKWDVATDGMDAIAKRRALLKTNAEQEAAAKKAEEAKKTETKGGEESGKPSQ